MTNRTVVDEGVRFGTWDDAVSRFMYHDSTPHILAESPTFRSYSGSAADFGGANGLMRKYLRNLVTIDSDASKKPDFIDDAITHAGAYDRVWCRYVLHYLSDVDVLRLVSNMLRCAPRSMIVQFVNDDLTAKYAASKFEGTKFFRTEAQTRALLDNAPVVRKVYEADYTVTAEFYANRLGNPEAKPHRERLVAYELFG